MTAALALQQEPVAGVRPAPTRRDRAVAFGTGAAAAGDRTAAPIAATLPQSSQSGSSASPIQYTRGSLVDVKA
jgi:hypothetical protein